MSTQFRTPTPASRNRLSEVPSGEIQIPPPYYTDLTGVLLVAGRRREFPFGAMLTVAAEAAGPGRLRPRGNSRRGRQPRAGPRRRAAPLSVVLTRRPRGSLPARPSPQGTAAGSVRRSAALICFPACLIYPFFFFFFFAFMLVVKPLSDSVLRLLLSLPFPDLPVPVRGFITPKEAVPFPPPIAFPCPKTI